MAILKPKITAIRPDQADGRPDRVSEGLAGVTPQALLSGRNAQSPGPSSRSSGTSSPTPQPGSPTKTEVGGERPLTRRGSETRRRIVAAAAELIFENGMAETTLKDIRAAAGVSSSQVYHYFEDKQALVCAVIDYQTDAVLDTQGTYLDQLDTVPGLRAWRDFLVEHQRGLGCRGGCPIGALGAQVAKTDAAARLAAAWGLRRWQARIRDGFRAMHARGDLPAQTDPDELALATLAALHGGMLLTQLQRDTRPLEIALDAMLDRIQILARSAQSRGRSGTA